jgi:hypothetical protein
MKKLIFGILLITLGYNADGQILISLLFGDKLNSEKLEFGLDGGVNIPRIRGEENGKAAGKFNLGFYFEIKFNNLNWMLHTGVIGISNMGTRGLPVYLLGDSLLDANFEGGQVHRELGYFNIPIMIKHVFKNKFYIQGGGMIGLLHTADDVFSKNVINKEDLLYTLDIKDDLNKIDAGIMGGIGYRLLGGNGMNLAIRYYYGLVNLNKSDALPKNYNESIYFAVGIPIGAGKKKTETKDEN